MRSAAARRAGPGNLREGGAWRQVKPLIFRIESEGVGGREADAKAVGGSAGVMNANRELGVAAFKHAGKAGELDADSGQRAAANEGVKECGDPERGEDRECGGARGGEQG